MLKYGFTAIKHIKSIFTIHCQSVSPLVFFSCVMFNITTVIPQLAQSLSLLVQSLSLDHSHTKSWHSHVCGATSCIMDGGPNGWGALGLVSLTQKTMADL